MKKFTPDSSFEYRITPNFRYGELTKDVEARRFTEQHQCDTAKEICEFLEKVRTNFGNKAIRPTSGHRPPAINKKTKRASSRSEHLYDMPEKGAVDIATPGTDINKVYKWVDENWPYTVGDGRHLGFVHIGIRPGRPKVRFGY